MAHRVSGSPANSASQPYDLISTTASHDYLPRKDDTKSTAVEIRSDPFLISRNHAQYWSAGQVLLTATIPVVALTAWLGRIQASSEIFKTFAGETIGGRFSQAEAKAIDVVTGAILAPIFMAALNYVWFTSARVSAVNEQQQRPIPLRTLVTASVTSAGTYDLFHLRNLLQGKTWRLFSLGVLMLLSAASRSALSNIIAYEAFPEDVYTTSNTVRLQRDSAIEAGFLGPAGFLYPSTSITTLDLYDFDASQNSQVAREVVALLTDLSYEDAASRLVNGTYIGINATAKSLQSFPESLSKLENVPAYRLSVDCFPALPISISVMQPLSFINTQVTLMFNITATSNNTIFQANYPGTPKDIQTGDGDGYTYAAFSMGSLEAYLGGLQRFNLTNETSPSNYGDVGFHAFNMTGPALGFDGTQSVMSVSGIRCSLYREQGSLNYTRYYSSNGGGAAWNISSTQFPDKQKKVLIPSMLAHFQWTNLNFHAPGSVIPGLGPALAPSSGFIAGMDRNDSFSDFALNYLYASGEAQRIMYEVAASSTNTTRSPSAFFTDVPALVAQQRYRITYVPSILLLGLLCLLAASLVTIAMAIYVRNTASARAHRQVNVTRLLLDSVLGLQESKPDMEEVAQGSNNDIDIWAAGYKVQYSSVDDVKGTVQIVLEKHEAR